MRSRWREPVPRDGRDGVDADPVAIQSMIDAAVARALADRPVPRNGRDVDPKDIERLVRAAFEAHVGGVRQDGTAPARGPRGPIGPMPAHRWRGTKLQFEQAPGNEWGDEVDLQGPKGEPALNGGGGGVVTINQGGGGSGWFPGGW